VGAGGVIVILVIAGTISVPWSTQTQEPSITMEDYYNTTDLEIYSYDDLAGSTIDGDVKFYVPGAPVNDYYKQSGDAKLLMTATTSSGTATLSGWDAEKYPTANVLMDVANYYNTLYVSEDLTVPKSSDDNTLGMTFRAVKMGTIDTSKTTTSEAVDASTSETFTFFYGNSVSDTEIHNPVIKISSTTNVTIDSADGGDLIEVDGTQYIVLDQAVISGGDYATVSIEITPSQASGSFTVVYDDLMGQYGYDAIPTDSDIHSVSSSSQTITLT
jgi:hypothetical protein